MRDATRPAGGFPYRHCLACQLGVMSILYGFQRVVIFDRYDGSYCLAVASQYHPRLIIRSMVNHRAKRIASGFGGNSIGIRKGKGVIHGADIGQPADMCEKNSSVAIRPHS